MGKWLKISKSKIHGGVWLNLEKNQYSKKYDIFLKSEKRHLR
jgi:hypothetical protein